mmetsp:Transcript_16832/g.42990  ORF Transcript_16832/g.42990 Transcript_16832/m.42990 type:complete len:242 (+) Transcript_16832:123-848(+)
MAASKGLAIITGASSGIGKATAVKLSQDGYSLLLIARRVELCNELNLPNCLAEKVDITNYDAFAAAVAKAEEKFGPTQVMVNNAGVMLLGQIAEQDPNEWATMVSVNITGLLNGTKLVLAGMIKRESGTIVNVSSIAGRKTFPDHAVYCATKFAVHGFTEAVREETSKHNVRFVCIAPGVCETELLGHTTNDKIVDNYKAWKGTFKVLESVDVANAISYAVNQPPHVCIREIVIGPTKQPA